MRGLESACLTVCEDIFKPELVRCGKLVQPYHAISVICSNFYTSWLQDPLVANSFVTNCSKNWPFSGVQVFVIQMDGQPDSFVGLVQRANARKQRHSTSFERRPIWNPECRQVWGCQCWRYDEVIESIALPEALNTGPLKHRLSHA